MIGGIIADGGGGITPLVAEEDKDVDAPLEWAGCGGLGTEVGDGLAADGILLIVEGEDNLSCPAEMLGGSIPGRRKSPTKNMISMRGQNWTVRQWPVHFVYSQDRRQK